MMTHGRGMRRAIWLIVILALAARALRAMGLPLVSRYIVEGSSMEPAFRPGDRVLVNRLAYRSRHPRAGEVVVLRDPERQGHVLLKRIAEAPEQHGPSLTRVYVLGDNAAESRDSRAFGTVALEQVLGRAWIKY
jgi:nickel-type superoxide dismutase maturation protease